MSFNLKTQAVAYLLSISRYSQTYKNCRFLGLHNLYLKQKGGQSQTG